MSEGRSEGGREGREGVSQHELCQLHVPKNVQRRVECER